MTDERTRTPMWSPWGDRLIATLSVGLAFCMAWWWTAVSYLNLPISTYLVWKPRDWHSPFPPNAGPLLGIHYFSDFQESRWWGSEILHGISPYDFPNLYPPISTWLMVPFAALPVTPALGLFLVLSAVGLVLPCWLLLRGLPMPTRIVVTALIAALTAPFLATFDRGNLQGLTIGALGFGLVALQRSRVRWAFAFFVLAICLKPIMVVFVVVALARGRVRFGVNVAVVAVLTTLVAAVLLPLGPINVYGMVKRQLEASVGPDFTLLERVLPNVSFQGLVANVEVLIHRGIPEGGLAIQHVPAATVFTALTGAAIAFVVAWRRSVPQWVWVAVGLSAIQLAQPYAGAHTASWVTLAAVFFGAGAVLPESLVRSDTEHDDRWLRALRILTLLAIVVTLLPMALRPTFGDVDVPVQQILGPLLWISVGLLALVASLARPSARKAVATVI